MATFNIAGMEARTYYTVPSHYTIGQEFPTRDEAEAHARASIVPAPMRLQPGQVRRAYVDMRLAGSFGDILLERTEITVRDFEEGMSMTEQTVAVP